MPGLLGDLMREMRSCQRSLNLLFAQSPVKQLPGAQLHLRDPIKKPAQGGLGVAGCDWLGCREIGTLRVMSMFKLNGPAINQLFKLGCQAYRLIKQLAILGHFGRCFDVEFRVVHMFLSLTIKQLASLAL